jgi:hypothetical protein
MGTHDAAGALEGIAVGTLVAVAATDVIGTAVGWGTVGAGRDVAVGDSGVVVAAAVTAGAVIALPVVV